MKIHHTMLDFHGPIFFEHGKTHSTFSTQKAANPSRKVVVRSDQRLGKTTLTRKLPGND